ncbi:hypothetical protein LTR16_003166 [Cryomyces antarcticus]|uniref:Uncharacterized protein n=1 Tax=Cryomyces antarcticus TaxID=329879 RepID=A0ABR0KSX3_9PEZI|nr:hypothetical protein LTR16_003166 [Cryomyces antarcticus]
MKDTMRDPTRKPTPAAKAAGQLPPSTTRAAAAAAGAAAVQSLPPSEYPKAMTRHHAPPAAGQHLARAKAAISSTRKPLPPPLPAEQRAPEPRGGRVLEGMPLPDLTRWIDGLTPADPDSPAADETSTTSSDSLKTWIQEGMPHADVSRWITQAVAARPPVESLEEAWAVDEAELRSKHGDGFRRGFQSTYKGTKPARPSDGQVVYDALKELRRNRTHKRNVSRNSDLTVGARYSGASKHQKKPSLVDKVIHVVETMADKKMDREVEKAVHTRDGKDIEKTDKRPKMAISKPLRVVHNGEELSITTKAGPAASTQIQRAPPKPDLSKKRLTAAEAQKLRGASPKPRDSFDVDVVVNTDGGVIRPQLSRSTTMTKWSDFTRTPKLVPNSSPGRPPFGPTLPSMPAPAKVAAPHNEAKPLIRIREGVDPGARCLICGREELRAERVCADCKTARDAYPSPEGTPPPLPPKDPNPTKTSPPHVMRLANRLTTIRRTTYEDPGNPFAGSDDRRTSGSVHSETVSERAWKANRTEWENDKQIVEASHTGEHAILGLGPRLWLKPERYAELVKEDAAALPRVSVEAEFLPSGSYWKPTKEAEDLGEARRRTVEHRNTSFYGFYDDILKESENERHR